MTPAEKMREPLKPCPFCDGLGIISTQPGIDPFDPGQPCPKCEGAGVVEVDLNDEINQ